MIDEYFVDWEIKPEFQTEFITLWNGWLTRERFHLLDEVTELQWAQFNQLIRALFLEFTLYSVNHELGTCTKVDDIDTVIPSYEEDMNRGEAEFTQLIIPEIGAVLAETWDFTYMLWHKDVDATTRLSPFVKNAGLYHFNDNS